MLKWTRRMRILIYRPAKLAPFLILCCWVLLWFRILWYFPSKRCQEQLESNQNLKQGAGFERVVLSSFFPKLARSEALKYLVSFLWNLSGASAGLNALARASKDWKSFRSREKPHGSVCPPFWILTVEWSGTRSYLFWWRHRIQIASFSQSTLENSVFKKHSFQIAPLWRAFSNGSVFDDRFRRVLKQQRMYPESDYRRISALCRHWASQRMVVKICQPTLCSRPWPERSYIM